MPTNKSRAAMCQWSEHSGICVADHCKEARTRARLLLLLIVLWVMRLA